MPPERPDKKKLSEQSVEACRRALDALGQQLLDGEISVSDFEATFKAEMKAEYIRQYLFGIGGLAYMTAEDWATVAKDLEAQYKYADDYIDELEDAALEDDDGLALAALLWRLGLYAVSAGAVYELANNLFHKSEGYTEERWNLDDDLGDDFHCPTCPIFFDMGWVEIGTLPEPGDGHTECGNRCHCWKTYRKEDGTESE